MIGVQALARLERAGISMIRREDDGRAFGCRRFA
jgi:hypothetical protein